MKLTKLKSHNQGLQLAILFAALQHQYAWHAHQEDGEQREEEAKQDDDDPARSLQSMQAAAAVMNHPTAALWSKLSPPQHQPNAAQDCWTVSNSTCQMSNLPSSAGQLTGALFDPTNIEHMGAT
jgi:hypothetical protein